MSLRLVLPWPLAVCLFALPVLGQAPNPTEKQIVELTNKFRVEQGFGKLAVDATLLKIAQEHAGNMARQDKYGDTNKDGHVLDGKGPGDRAKAGGYRYRRLAENVGACQGYPNPGATTMEGWEKSPGHRQNLLTKEFTDIGVGAAQSKSGKWYFVQVFGLPASQAVKVMVEIENRTGHTITFRVANKEYALEAGATSQLTCSTSTDAVILNVTWPDPKAGGDKVTLRDRTRYAFVQKGPKFSVLVIGK